MPIAEVKSRGAMRSVAPGANLLDRIPLARSIAPYRSLLTATRPRKKHFGASSATALMATPAG